jgi:hypothetical protein
VSFGNERLDSFPAFLLERVRFARARGIFEFKLTHPNGDELRVTATPTGSKIEVLRRPKVPIPGPFASRARLLGNSKMMLVTSERELMRDVVTGITSYQAEAWRG